MSSATALTDEGSSPRPAEQSPGPRRGTGSSGNSESPKRSERTKFFDAKARRKRRDDISRFQRRRIRIEGGLDVRMEGMTFWYRERSRGRRTCLPGMYP